MLCKKLLLKRVLVTIFLISLSILYSCKSDKESLELANIDSMYDYNMDNFLNIINDKSNDLDAVIFVMRKDEGCDENCARAVHLRPGEDITMKNFPEGLYALKISYGSKWKNVDNHDMGGYFREKALFEETGDNLIDFNKIKTENGWEVPNYQLTLDL